MVETARILVVDDEPAVRAFLRDVLDDPARQVVTAESVEDALERIAAEEFDLVLLDLKLRGRSGMAVLAEVGERWPDTAVIVLTGHASLETAIEALRRGAHDYLFKPCKTMELRQSVREALRRRQEKLEQREFLTTLRRSLGVGLEQLRALDGGRPARAPSAAEPDGRDGRFLRQGGLIVDLARHAIMLDGCQLELTPTEFELLAYLASEAPRVVPPQELVQAVQGYECARDEASDIARVHVYHIRQKVEAATGRRDVIRTVRGVGYGLGGGR
jgi:DNA-binding response OmpR family regulator